MNIRILAILLLVALMLSSCTGKGSADEPVLLSFWTTNSSEETEFLKKRIEAFSKANPTIRVKVEQHTFPFATSEFKTAVLGDQSVDIFRADNTWVPEYAELDIIYPLNQLADADALSGYIPSTLTPLRYQGKLYGLPSVIEVPALLYNKRLLSEAGFTKPPDTMDDMLTMAKALTSNGHYGLFMPDDSYYALPYLWAFGGGMVSEDGKILIASEESQRALSFMVRLRQEGVTQPYADFADWYNRMMSDFVNGKVAMIFNGPWAMVDLMNGKEFKQTDYLGIAPIPKGPEGQGSPIGGHSFVINKYSKHPRESLTLIAYLTNTETQVLQSRKFKTLPTQSAAYRDERLSNDKMVQGFKEPLDKAKARPVIPEGAKLFMDFTPNLNAMLLQRLTVQQGVTNIEESWSRLLE
ncbi:arabinogalactan oligomer/maltooligosaccharide transport system substrate-binding protein [Paenibacillus phyllosphaerae]|uniref:Arabinogalactan oligomer/maltooligosaccharide transport system substrate-binding protein n=1 Tax=Paenibacillus phyllosphaerae TaxID=274593 RepID=A0A7W5FRB6_9BACL|nr:extracellular solute-binding protein [Paenibacillus phyllosphaerae]MBB3114355.1 arabinogalactan oligomer/maltooligosaccharide transport system substrate-binding protein [Paenibacillus phyllosphaerae]